MRRNGWEMELFELSKLFSNDKLKEINSLRLENLAGYLDSEVIHRESKFITVNRKELDDFCFHSYRQEGGEVYDNIIVESIHLKEKVLACFDKKSRKVVFNSLSMADCSRWCGVSCTTIGYGTYAESCNGLPGKL